MGRRKGRMRPETLLVLILALLSAGIVSASVAVALDGFHQRYIGGPVAVLPDVLFSPAPTRAPRVAPVAGNIQSELDARASDTENNPIELPDPSPSSSPGSSPLPTSSPTIQPSPAARTSMTVELSQVLGQTGGSNKRTITYTGRIQNTGDVPLQNLVFRSHVPKKTTWNDYVCGGNRLPITVHYDGGGREVVCIPGGPSVKGSDDPSIHPVTYQLTIPIQPRSSIRFEFVVDVDDDATGNVVNHCHAEANGLSVETNQAVTPLS